MYELILEEHSVEQSTAISVSPLHEIHMKGPGNQVYELVAACGQPTSAEHESGHSCRQPQLITCNSHGGWPPVRMAYILVPIHVPAQLWYYLESYQQCSSINKHH
jgi:hypothetical protein